MIKVILSILVLATGFQAQASYFSKEDFKVAVGGQFNSQLYKRGIITYGGFQAAPIYAVQLFNPDLMLAGSALYYKKNITDNLFLRSRLNFDSTKDRPLYETSEKEIERVERERTTEFDLFLEYTFPEESFLRFLVSQDLIAHKGQYLEARARLALFDLYKKTNEKALLQLGVFSSIGYGSGKHNEYLYGRGAEASGFSNFEYGLSVTSPKVIDSFWPTLRVSRFHLLGEGNKNGSYVKETSGWSVEALFAFAVFP